MLQHSHREPGADGGSLDRVALLGPFVLPPIVVVVGVANPISHNGGELIAVVVEAAAATAAAENSRWMLNGSLDSRDLVPNINCISSSNNRRAQSQSLSATIPSLFLWILLLWQWYEEIENKNVCTNERLRQQNLGGAANTDQAAKLGSLAPIVKCCRDRKLILLWSGGGPWEI